MKYDNKVYLLENEDIIAHSVYTVVRRIRLGDTIPHKIQEVRTDFFADCLRFQCQIDVKLWARAKNFSRNGY